MSIHTFTGRLTNAQRIRFAASRNARLFVQPKQPGFGETGLISDQRIPVDWDEADGSFTVRLEASVSVSPLMLYQFGCEWQQDGQNHWAIWGEFRALVGGGEIGDMRYGNQHGGVMSYGDGDPGDKHGITRGFYIDISGETPVLYGEEGARV